MDLCALTLFGRQLTPEQLHGLFFGGLGLLALVWILFAWKRGDKLANTIAVAASVLTFFFLTSPYATDAARWWVAGGIMSVVAVLLWRSRDRVWKPLFLASGGIAALLAVFLTSSSVNILFFEKYLTKIGSFYLLGCLAWLAVQVVIPRTRGKQQAVQAAGLTVIISLVMALVALAWWLEAVDGNALPNSPVVTTGAEVTKLFSDTPGTRRLGIFAEGVIGDPTQRSEGEPGDSEILTYFIERLPGTSIGGEEAVSLPSSLEMRMKDGAIVSVSGLNSVRQTWNWPEQGPRFQQRSLRHGDRIVVWADPGELRSASDGARTPALTATRVIAYGDFESFRADFLGDLVKTSRVFGWIAIVCLFLSAIPLGFGIRHLFRHRGMKVPDSN